MLHLSSLSSNRIADTGAAAATPVAVLLNPQAYQLLSIAIGLSGVLIARQIFIDQENKQLGRKQTFRETLPLTLAATIIAGPLLVDHSFSVSVSAMLGLSVGYSTILFIKLMVKAWTGVFRVTLRTMAAQTYRSLSNSPVPAEDDAEIDRLERQLDDIPDKPV